ncbi:hypothetical protein MTP99_011255 [Tenebrio molitor]|nr:hypothetical protein MTP99_011255 [Tenebrio molitor]
MKITRILSNDILRFKITKLLLGFTFLVHFITSLIQTFSFLSDFDFYYFMKYAPIYFASFYVLLTIVTAVIIAETNLIINLFEKVELEKIEKCCITTYKSFKKESQFITFIFIATLLIVLYSAYLHILSNEDDREIFYVLAFIEDHCPHWKDLLILLYKSTFPIVAYVTPLPTYQFLYGITHTKSQIYLVKERLENINTGYDITNNAKLFYDQKYQKIIKQRLMFAHKRHVKLLICGAEFRNFSRIFIALYALIGSMFGISIVFFILMFQGNIFDKLERLITVSVATVTTFTVVIMAGQKVEDATSQEVNYVIDNCNWYDWNEENKKFFLMLRLMTTNMFKLKFSQNYAINYELGIVILKTIYSALSVLKVVRDKNLPH